MTSQQRNFLQVRAFYSVYRQLLRIGEKSVEECFAEAVAVTSDEVFESILLKKSELIEKWMEDYGSKKKKAS